MTIVTAYVILATARKAIMYMNVQRIPGVAAPGIFMIRRSYKLVLSLVHKLSYSMKQAGNTIQSISEKGVRENMKQKRERNRILSLLLAVILLCQEMSLSVLAQTNEKEEGGGGETELRMESAETERYSASLNQEGLNSESKISPNGL